jgi:hypothetical protein
MIFLNRLRRFVNPSFFTFDTCKQGYSHIESGKECQDYASSCYFDRYAIAVVSDGHGGNDYFRSSVGSRLAVEAALDCVKVFVNVFIAKNKFNDNMLSQIVEMPDKFLRQLEMSIVSRWREKTYEHYLRDPFTLSEISTMSEKLRSRYEEAPNTQFVKAYGATLIVVAVLKQCFWFGLQLGDGKCVVLYKNGEIEHPIPINEKCFLNQTTSLCDETPLDEFRHHFDWKNFPRWLFVGSDGVENSFNGDEGLNNFYEEVARAFRKKYWRDAIAELNEYLPMLSRKGSRDDVSISGIFNK